MPDENLKRLLTVGFGMGIGGFLIGLSYSRRAANKEKAEEKSPRRPAREEKKEVDYSSLGFSFNETNGFTSHKWTAESNKWDDGKFVEGFYQQYHVMAGAFHYGQTLFEGFKAFRTKSNRIAIFYMEGSCERLKKGCRRLLMPEVPTEVFKTAVIRAVNANANFVPPYGSGASMYIRPVIFSSGAVLSAKTDNPEFTFNVIVSPVGGWFAGGLAGGSAVVCQEFDRAAPKGVGGVKAGGNYAAARLASKISRNAGFQLTLFLDSKERKYIEEFSTSNFVAIDKDGKFVTPKSDSILASNTNKVLQQLARDNGIEVEIRPIEWEEVPTLKEVAACGTAVIVKPVTSITNGDQVVEFEGFETIEMLYHQFRAIQLGEQEDKHGWMHYV